MIVAVPPTSFTTRRRPTVKLLLHLGGAENTAGTVLPSTVSVPSIFAGPQFLRPSDFNSAMAIFTFCMSCAWPRVGSNSEVAMMHPAARMPRLRA